MEAVACDVRSQTFGADPRHLAKTRPAAAETWHATGKGQPNCSLTLHYLIIFDRLETRSKVLCVVQATPTQFISQKGCFFQLDSPFPAPKSKESKGLADWYLHIWTQNHILVRHSTDVRRAHARRKTHTRHFIWTLCKSNF